MKFYIIIMTTETNIYLHTTFLHEEIFHDNQSNLFRGCHDFVFKKFLIRTKDQPNNEFLPEAPTTLLVTDFYSFTTKIYPTKTRGEYLVIIDSDQDFIAMRHVFSFQLFSNCVSALFVYGMLNNEARLNLLCSTSDNWLKLISSKNSTQPLYFINIIPLSPLISHNRSIASTTTTTYEFYVLNRSEAHFLIIKVPCVESVSRIRFTFDSGLQSNEVGNLRDLQNICKYVLSMKTDKNCIIFPFSCTNKIDKNSLLCQETANSGFHLHRVGKLVLEIIWKDKNQKIKEENSLEFWIGQSNKPENIYLSSLNHPDILPTKSWHKNWRKHFEKNNIKKNIWRSKNYDQLSNFVDIFIKIN